MPSYVFWREGYEAGRGGAYIRAQSINKIIPTWILEGIQVAGIVVDPEHESNVELILFQPEETDGTGGSSQDGRA